MFSCCDAVEAQGSDDLSVDVIYNGRSVPAEVDPEGHNRYHVSFTPVGSGKYTIHIYYGGTEVTGMTMVKLMHIGNRELPMSLHLDLGFN